MNIHEAMRELLAVSEKLEAIIGPIQEHVGALDGENETVEPAPITLNEDAVTVDLQNLLGEVRTVTGALYLFCFGLDPLNWDECRKRADCRPHTQKDADAS